MSPNPKVLIVDTYYKKMLNFVRTKQSEPNQHYWESVYDDLLLGTGFSYNYFLKKLGYSSNLIIANNPYHYHKNVSYLDQIHWSNAYYYSRLFSNSKNLLRFSPLHINLLSFIEKNKPDLIFAQDINLFPPVYSKILRKMGIKLLGEIASPLPPDKFLLNFDHIISSLPNIVQYASKIGVDSTFHQLGFDHRIIERLSPAKKAVDIVFVGSFTSQHTNVLPILVNFSNNFSSFKIFGNVSTSLLRKFNLLKNYEGEVWGKVMFEVISKAKIVLNRHSAISESYANNMRMFEVTGVGSLLLTEKKKNLPYYFPGDDLISAYDGPQDALDKADKLLLDEKQLNLMSSNSQDYTLNNHTYEKLTLKLKQIFDSIF